MYIISAADFPLFCSNSHAWKCLILPAECSPPKSLILLEILPEEHYIVWFCQIFWQFWKPGSRDCNTFSVTFPFSSSNKGVPSHSPEIKDTTQTRIITLYIWDKRLSRSLSVLHAVSNKKRLLSSHINFINRLIKINCVASYCACSQYLTDWVTPSRLTWRAWWQEQGIMGREKRRKSKSLSLDFLFRIQARARSTTNRWKTWRINRLAINKYNSQRSLYFGTVLYDLLSQCFSGRKRIGWLLKFEVFMTEMFLFAW